MKGEHKLRLVKPVDAAGEMSAFPDEPEPTEAEIREAEALRASMERGDDALASALRAAHGSSSMDDELHAAMIERALAGPSSEDAQDAPPSPSERASADRLREAMEAGRSRTEEAPLVEVGEVLRAAYRPRDIEPLRNEALIARALARASSRRKAGRVLPIVTVLVASAAAMAAGIALYLAPAADAPASSVASAPALVRSRSAAGLFDPTTPFPRAGGESARVDRIASARAAELRENRFAAWGVR